MDLSPTIVESGMSPASAQLDLRPVFILLMIIATIAFLIRGRTPAFIVVVFFWPASLLGAYIIVMVGFSWPLLLIFLMIFLSAIAIWKGLKDERISPYLGAVAIVGVFLLLVTLFGGGAGEIIPIEVGGDGEAPSIAWDDPGGYIETAFGGFGTLMLIILVGGIIAYLLVQRVVPIIRSSPEEEDEKELEDQLSSTMDRAVTELREGKDVHSTILRCYQKMCLILEKEGAKNFEFMTPREFERQAMRTLDVSTSKITDIRKVFELAKYSNYRLGDEERDRALKSLKELREELR